MSKTDYSTARDGYLLRGFRERILWSEHDSKVVGHFGQDKTLELVYRNFWWPSMKAEIIQYIQSCDA